MVLQAQPTPAKIWGFLDGTQGKVDLQGTCVIDGEDNIVEDTFVPSPDDDLFQFEVAFPEGTICSFRVLGFDLDQATEVIDDVIFGDVWVCSGQSNMGWAMRGVTNRTEEVAKTAEYPNIRMYRNERMYNDTPQDDISEEYFDVWAKSDDADHVLLFSSICLL